MRWGDAQPAANVAEMYTITNDIEMHKNVQRKVAPNGKNIHTAGRKTTPAIKAALKAATEKSANCSNSTSATQHKHSALFYISPLLFQNKRLKQKRCKWTALLATKGRNRKKTEESRKKCLSTLRAEVTIDLLSDDDAVGNSSISTNVNNNLNIVNGGEQSSVLPHLISAAPLLQPDNMQHYYVYPGHIQLSTVPNIQLIPVQQMLSRQALQKRVKRKRKTRPPKRHAQPTIVNNESIVLTDDSDIERMSSPVATSLPTVKATSPKLTIANCTSVQAMPPQTPPEQEPPQLQPKLSTTFIANNVAQVDEEVTVSIVPRSIAAGSCSKPQVNSQLFPMLPDETTVHTVIANRIYELSLTKLREGLASSGAGDGEQKVSPTRRKGKVNAPIAVTPPPPPVSLKLSSDLSISLISDDDDDDDGGAKHQQLLNAEKLLQQQPQLSVQQVRLPIQPPTEAVATGAAMATPPNNTTQRPAPRRRKLG